MNELIRTLNAYKIQHQLSQHQLADLLGIDQSMVSRLLSGKREVTLPILKAIYRIPQMRYDVMRYLEE